MTFIISILATTVFLLGAVAGMLAILVAGIHRDDRARTLTSAPRTRTEAITRRVLGVGIRDTRCQPGEPR